MLWAVASNLVHGSNEARRGKLGCAVAKYQEEPIEVLGHGGGALAWSLVRTNDGCEFRVIYEDLEPALLSLEGERQERRSEG